MKTTTFKTNLQRYLVPILFICFGISNSYSQIDLRACNAGFSCTSNNFMIERVYLVDASTGVELAISNQTCNVGDPPIMVSLGFDFTSNQNGNVYNGRVFADLSIDGISTVITPFIGDIPGTGDYGPALFGSLNLKDTYTFPWSCGQEIILNNLVTVWRTSGTGDFSADDSYDCGTYGQSQCEFAANIVVQAPLSISADYDACFDGTNTEVTFTPDMTNGTAPYTYDWMFYEIPNPVL